MKLAVVYTMLEGICEPERKVGRGGGTPVRAASEARRL
jgi:hypothetical protein